MLCLALGAAVSLDALPASLGGALGIGVGLAGPRLARRFGERTWNRIGLGVLAMLALFGLVWVTLFSSMQGSDFGVYYRCGATAAASWAQRIDTCQSVYLEPSLVFWARSLFYTVPWGFFPGASVKGLTVINALLQAVTLGMLFLLVRQQLGSPAAVFALCLMGIFPERIWSLTLITPDHVTSLLLVTLLYLFARVEEPLEPGRRVLGLAMLGAVLFAIDMTRNVGVLLLVAMVLCFLLAPRSQDRRRAVAQTVLVVAVFVVAGAVLQALLPVPLKNLSFLRLASSLNLLASQSYGDMYRWGQYLWPAMPAEERTAFALRRLVDEVQMHFSNYPAYLFTKARTLVGADGYLFFATADLTANPDTLLSVPRSTVPRIPTAVAHGAAALLLGASLVGVSRAPRKSAALVSVVSSAVIWAVILGISEVQARYLLIIVPCLALVAAASFAADARLLPSPRVWMKAVGILGSCTLVVGAGLWALNRGRVNPLEQAVLIAASECGDGAKVYATSTSLKLELPAQVSCADIRVPLPEETRGVRFFVSRSELPMRFEPRADVGLEWKASFTGLEATKTALGTEMVRWQKIERTNAEGSSALSVRFTRSDVAQPLAVELLYLQTW